MTASTAAGAVESDLLLRHRLPALLAQRAINAAIASCELKGHHVSAALVDVDGGMQSLLRGNGAGIQTVQSATDKAITSAVYGVDSSIWVDRAARGEVISPLLNQLPHLLLAKGGLAIKAGEEVVGGIAVAGAPAGEIDESCAKAGLDVIMSAVGQK